MKRREFILEQMLANRGRAINGRAAAGARLVEARQSGDDDRIAAAIEALRLAEATEQRAKDAVERHGLQDAVDLLQRVRQEPAVAMDADRRGHLHAELSALVEEYGDGEATWMLGVVLEERHTEYGFLASVLVHEAWQTAWGDRLTQRMLRLAAVVGEKWLPRCWAIELARNVAGIALEDLTEEGIVDMLQRRQQMGMPLRSVGRQPAAAALYEAAQIIEACACGKPSNPQSKHEPPLCIECDEKADDA